MRLDKIRTGHAEMVLLGIYVVKAVAVKKAVASEQRQLGIDLIEKGYARDRSC